MKRFIFMSFAFVLCLYSLSAQTSRALLVAIDRYPENSGWQEIHASNDTRIILPVLLQKGYKQENIRLLLNENATKQAILKVLEQIRAQSRSGDCIYLHFSCHGQNMLDDNGDEEDGLDEALIPYDAAFRYSKGVYEGENHLRDDELEKYIDSIRKKITASGNLTVVIDACHSGTGTRENSDDDYIRGTSYIFAPDESGISEPEPGKLLRPRHKQAKNLAAITVFSACLADEINYEYKNPEEKAYYGTLSYAFAKVMKEDSGQSTAIQLFEAIKREMQILSANRKGKQTPYFETTDESKFFNIGK